MNSADMGQANDKVCAACQKAIKDGVKWHMRGQVVKYANPGDHAAGFIQEVVSFEKNLLLNEGINELFTILCSSGGTLFDNSNAYLGVGDDNTAASASQTGLQAVTNKLYKAMDASYPTYGTDQKATFKATFGASDANFDWEEITVANGNSDSADNLNRKVQSLGTKASPAVWELTVEISLS